jgi:hypothetical protein
MAELLSRRVFNNKRYKLISKSGSKAIAEAEAKKWKGRGKLVRIVKLSSTGWKYGIYITE